jgi:hypothetical protein
LSIGGAILSVGVLQLDEEKPWVISYSGDQCELNCCFRSPSGCVKFDAKTRTRAEDCVRTEEESLPKIPEGMRNAVVNHNGLFEEWYRGRYGIRWPDSTLVPPEMCRHRPMDEIIKDLKEIFYGSK